ncbi:MAG: UxaA family hydrolase, partial [Thermogutta sp.]|nr:UxaA family hydrolase [Thermogutta sp.]
IAKGTTLKLDRVRLTAASNLRMGHKVAVRPIAEGEAVVKYGHPIGVATVNIEPGQWVHVHNMRSAYITTRDRRGADPTLAGATESAGHAQSPSPATEEAQAVSAPDAADASAGA